MAEAFPVVFALYPRVTQLDFTGPYEVLARMPGAEIVIVGKQRGPVRDPRTHWTLTAEASIAEAPRPDVLVLPGWMQAVAAAYSASESAIG